MTAPAIFAIGVARAEGRRARLTARLDAIGARAEFVDAIDLAETGDPYGEMPEYGPWGWISPGVAVCTRSHRLAWRRFLDGDAPCALVLEDDAILSRALVPLLEDCDWWPEGAEIVKLERWKSERMKVALGRRVGASGGIAFQRLLSRHPGSAAYFVTRQAARHLLDQGPPNLAIDQWLFNPLVSETARRPGVLQSVPGLAVQEPEDGEQIDGVGARRRPDGAARRQSLRRGLAEVRGALRLAPALATGAARLIRLPLAEDLSGARS